MLDGMTEAEASEWTGLLKHARTALSHFDTDELAHLQARAECMMAAYSSQTMFQVCHSHHAGLVEAMNCERRLLRDLLDATKQNIHVFESPKGGSVMIQSPREGAKWAR